MGDEAARHLGGRTVSRGLLAIDQGTTGTRAVVFTLDGDVAASAYEELPQHFPEPGWVEHDPEEIWAGVEATVRAAVREARDVEILAIGVTNQRETVVLWERATGRPVCR